MNNSALILQVAIPRPFLDTFEYTYDPNLEKPKIGARVVVPFGHQDCVGIVLGLAESSNLDDPSKIKPIKRLIDLEPILESKICQLLQWSARYYHHPIGDVVFTALPSLLRQQRTLPKTTYWTLTNQAEPPNFGRAKKQQAMYEWLQAQDGFVAEKKIQQHHKGSWKSSLKAMHEKGWVESTHKHPEPKPIALTQPTLTLTNEQQVILENIQTHFAEPKPLPFLLHGITGSGKTEIYLRTIRSYLEQGKQVLVLVPEIGLTPQIVQRFQAYYSDQGVVCLHSGLNDTERLEAWQQAKEQQAQIIIGTRSAIFAPCPALGIIIIDEEHDASFKQQESFRYHARDLALKRAHDLHIPILLGSATPSLESIHKTDQNRFHYGFLGKRPQAARPPSIQVQDTRGLHLQAGLSQYSLEQIQATLEKGEQVMLFINRRGFAHKLQCTQCGWTSQCDHCSAHMTYHVSSNKLICHHCLYEQHTPEACPKCHHMGLQSVGQGTERLELLLERRYKNTPVIRIDRDTTSRKGELQERLQQVHDAQAAILIGTQMLAKGHDFPNLTLVIILDVDQALLSTEYHALERFGQLLVQVAGRAGRAQKAGKVLLHTTQPDHPALQELLQHGYLSFAQQLLQSRENWQYPPYSYQVLIRASASDMDTTLQALHTIADYLKSLALPDIQFLGPIQALMEQRAGRFRAHLLLQSKNRKQLHQSIYNLTQSRKTLALHRSIRWSIDVDPIDLS